MDRDDTDDSSPGQKRPKWCCADIESRCKDDDGAQPASGAATEIDGGCRTAPPTSSSITLFSNNHQGASFGLDPSTGTLSSSCSCGHAIGRGSASTSSSSSVPPAGIQQIIPPSPTTIKMALKGRTVVLSSDEFLGFTGSNSPSPLLRGMLTTAAGDIIESETINQRDADFFEDVLKRYCLTGQLRWDPTQYDPAFVAQELEGWGLNHAIDDWAAVRGLFPLASMHFDENVYHMFAKIVFDRIVTTCVRKEKESTLPVGSLASTWMQPILLSGRARDTSLYYDAHLHTYDLNYFLHEPKLQRCLYGVASSHGYQLTIDKLPHPSTRVPLSVQEWHFKLGAAQVGNPLYGNEATELTKIREPLRVVFDRTTEGEQTTEVMIDEVRWVLSYNYKRDRFHGVTFTITSPDDLSARPLPPYAVSPVVVLQADEVAAFRSGHKDVWVEQQIEHVPFNYANMPGMAPRVVPKSWTVLHRGHTTKPGVLNSTFAPRSELDVPEFQPIENFPYAGVLIKPLSRMPLLGFCEDTKKETVGSEWKTNVYAVRLAAIPTMGTLL